MKWYKTCFGGAIGGGMGSGKIKNFSGKKCKHETLEGWTLEYGGSIGPISATHGLGLRPAFDGFKYFPGGGIDDLTGVDSISVGVSPMTKLKLGVKYTFCYYKFRSEKEYKCGCIDGGCTDVEDANLNWEQEYDEVQRKLDKSLESFLKGDAQNYIKSNPGVPIDDEMLEVLKTGKLSK